MGMTKEQIPVFTGMTMRQIQSLPRKREYRVRIDSHFHGNDKAIDSRFHGNDNATNKVIPSQEGIHRDKAIDSHFHGNDNVTKKVIPSQEGIQSAFLK